MPTAQPKPGKILLSPTDHTLAAQARKLEEAGCFPLVLECVPSEAARKVTDLLKIPTISIGAGPNVNGQRRRNCTPKPSYTIWRSRR
jgi:hypothetical protein